MLETNARHVWFPECRQCDCCKGFKQGCTCCVGAAVVCSCSSEKISTKLPNEVPAFRADPPPVVVDLPWGTHIVSIDVECAATSVNHNGRTISSIGMVDERGHCLLDLLIKPQVEVLSYLTPISGVQREHVESHGIPLDEALNKVRSCLSPGTVIVGQNILKDIQWLGLVEGVDFGSMVDLAALFRVWNHKKNSFTNFSQDHVAKVWLGIGDRTTHNALEDSHISISLFNAYRKVQNDRNQLLYYQNLTFTAERESSFAFREGSIDGCCLGNRKTCICGGAFL